MQSGQEYSKPKLCNKHFGCGANKISSVLYAIPRKCFPKTVFKKCRSEIKKKKIDFGFYDWDFFGFRFLYFDFFRH